MLHYSRLEMLVSENTSLSGNLKVTKKMKCCECDLRGLFHNTIFFLTYWLIKLVLHYTRFEMILSETQSSLNGPFEIYKENEVV
jgi:hypothetical protein